MDNRTDNGMDNWSLKRRERKKVVFGFLCLFLLRKSDLMSIG